MAVAEVNEAGGVLGQDVELVESDSGTDPDVANASVDTLLADPTKAREALGWTANTTFEELVQIMVEADLEAQERLSGRRRDRGRSPSRSLSPRAGEGMNCLRQVA